MNASPRTQPRATTPEHKPLPPRRLTHDQGGNVKHLSPVPIRNHSTPRRATGFGCIGLRSARMEPAWARATCPYEAGFGMRPMTGYGSDVCRVQLGVPGGRVQRGVSERRGGRRGTLHMPAFPKAEFNSAFRNGAAGVGARCTCPRSRWPSSTSVCVQRAWSLRGHGKWLHSHDPMRTIISTSGWRREFSDACI